ncbi:hypothetical protein D9M68_953040 [compost metagenome]
MKGDEQRAGGRFRSRHVLQVAHRILGDMRAADLPAATVMPGLEAQALNHFARSVQGLGVADVP